MDGNNFDFQNFGNSNGFDFGSANVLPPIEGGTQDLGFDTGFNQGDNTVLQQTAGVDDNFGMNQFDGQTQNTTQFMNFGQTQITQDNIFDNNALLGQNQTNILNDFQGDNQFVQATDTNNIYSGTQITDNNVYLNSTSSEPNLLNNQIGTFGQAEFAENFDQKGNMGWGTSDINQIGTYNSPQQNQVNFQTLNLDTNNQNEAQIGYGTYLTNQAEGDGQIGYGTTALFSNTDGNIQSVPFEQNVIQQTGQTEIQPQIIQNTVPIQQPQIFTQNLQPQTVAQTNLVPNYQQMQTTIPKQIPQPIQQIVPQQLPQVVPQPIQQVVPQQIQQIAPKQIQQVVPQQIPQVVPQPIQQVVPQQLQQTVPQPIQQIVPQPLQQTVQQPIQQVVPQQLQQTVQQPIQQVVPQQLQQTIPQPIQQVVPQQLQQTVQQPIQQIIPQQLQQTIHQPIQPNRNFLQDTAKLQMTLRNGPKIMDEDFQRGRPIYGDAGKNRGYVPSNIQNYAPKFRQGFEQNLLPFGTNSKINNKITYVPVDNLRPNMDKLTKAASYDNIRTGITPLLNKSGLGNIDYNNNVNRLKEYM